MKSESQLISPSRSSLLVIDVQEKLLPVISNQDEISRNLKRLLQATPLAQIPTVVSEQYPQGLGHTVEQIRDTFAVPSEVTPDKEPGKSAQTVSVFEKTTFSCVENKAIFSNLLESGKDQLVVTGIEAHICVVQSCLDLSRLGFQVFVVSDAVGSRNPDHAKLALSRMSLAGIPAVPTESVLFEWCRSAQHPEFKSFSRLIKDSQ